MTKRNPIKDKTAIVGLGTTPYSRDAGARSEQSLILDACIAAIEDAGLSAADIDGIAGNKPDRIQAALGIPGITYWSPHMPPFGNHVVAAMAAVHAGICDTVLAYHSAYRNPGWSRSAGKDGIRRRATAAFAAGMLNVPPESIFGGAGYAAWASRYIHEFGLKREQLALVALNNRANARLNQHAVMREPLSMQQYLEARMIREPLCLYDMDVPIDGADAVVITTTERARDLKQKPVLIHAAHFGQTHHADESQTDGIHATGQNLVVPQLWEKSDIKRNDIDVFNPYDGFSYITLMWLENAGFCGKGEAGAFLESNWDAKEGRLKLGGRLLVNTHGGSLSEGGVQGTGHYREAVVQLRGQAGARQIAGAKRALVLTGGLFFNAQGAILRTE